ncbi:MAG: DNA-directed RNA polymerase subunit alpha [Planctomycetes bacterium]|nr:DNA-directed RNA polymerase subunit alpha [Planctomycetota bacterium]
MRIRWRNLELPNKVTVNRETFNDTYGVFTVEPFERGFGHTIGNGLRRVLLSSLEGAAVVWVKIPGVEHEFMAIDDVVEDVTDIVLNLKSLKVSYGGDRPIRLTLDVKKKGAVTAADFACEADAEIINPELHLCTLSKEKQFSMEVEVRKARGYLTAEENEYGSVRGASRSTRKDVDQEIGKIWMDASFSPVLRVRYRIEDTRVGKLTDYDKLHLEVWTDGTVRPDHALVEASKIYRKHLNPFVSYDDAGGEMPDTDDVPEPKQEQATQEEEHLLRRLNTPIADLHLSMRSSNCLEAEQIRTVGELVQRTESDLLNVRNFGKTSLKEIVTKLEELGLGLGMQVPQQT